MNSDELRRAPIGVFDSGVGGLTVVREILQAMPGEHIVYFGDTARVPYGSKSPETIIHYARQIVHFLKTQQVKAIVVACNTASALALETIKAEVDLPMLGVLEPGARVAANTTKNGRIGVIATESTIESGLYQRKISDFNADATVLGQACPLFVPLVEEGWQDDPVTAEIAARYLRPLQDADIDTLILGCTHYPLLAPVLGKIMGPRVTLVNPAHEAARELKELLAAQNLNSGLSFTSRHRFFVSDAPAKFRRLASTILPFEIDEVGLVNIEEY